MSVKKAVKRGLTQRLRERVGMGDSDSSDEEKDSSKKSDDGEDGTEDGTSTLRGDGLMEKDFATEQGNGNKIKSNGSAKRGAFRGRGKSGRKASRDVEMGPINEGGPVEAGKVGDGKKNRMTSFQLPKAAASMTSMSMLEQSMPADAVLAKEGAEEVINLRPFHLFCLTEYFLDHSFCRISIRLLCLSELSPLRTSLKVGLEIFYLKQEADRCCFQS
jgi:metal transporter CNNM